MKGVLVDPYEKSILNVEIDDWRDIKKHLQCDISSLVVVMMKVVMQSMSMTMGLYEESAFWFCPDIYPEPYAGRVLFLGINRIDGESTDSWLDSSDVADMDYKWMSREGC